AYILLYPRVRVHTIVWLGFFVTTVALPAYVMLGYWFFYQLLLGTVGSLSRMEGGTAFWAHVGGFVAGMALIRVFVNPEYLERRRQHGPRLTRHLEQLGLGSDHAGAQQALGRLRDVHGVVAHALEVVGDLGGGDEQPQVPGHGLLRGEQIDHRLLDFELEGVD